MQLFNHAITGAIIALTVKDPAAAVPIATASHFFLDTLPHYSAREQFGLLTPKYFIPIVVDIILTTITIFAITRIWPHHAGIIELCALGAVAPDFFWPLEKSYVGKKFLSWYYTYHRGIQRYESVGGIRVEIAWAIGALAILSQLYPI